MPRETIWGEPGPDQINVSVLWSKESGHVQIATTPTGEGGYYAKRDEGYFRDLSRNEINSLIRALRKARDQAYGPDA